MNNSNYSLDDVLNEYAYRCFLDIADQDYILARISCQLNFTTNSNWLSLHSIEKYLKCILLLNRISSKNAGHNLNSCLEKIASIRVGQSGVITFTQESIDFIKQIYDRGKSRYLEKPSFFTDVDLHSLDKCILDIRRYSIANINHDYLNKIKVLALNSFLNFPLPGGYLEEIISGNQEDVKKALTWNNKMYSSKNEQFRMSGQNTPANYLYMPDEQKLKFYKKLNELIQIDDFKNIETELNNSILENKINLFLTLLFKIHFLK